MSRYTPEWMRPTKAEADRDAYEDRLEDKMRQRNLVNGPRVYDEGVKCGNCHEHHLTKKDVRWCCNLTYQMKAQRLLEEENARQQNARQQHKDR